MDNGQLEPMRVFILAGGFATRLWPLTEQRAKPLLPLAGQPLLSYVLAQIPAELSVTVSTNAVFAQDFKKWRKGIGRRNVEIIIEDTGHEDEKLGALGAVAQWLSAEKIDEDLLLLAGDNFVGCSMDTFLRLHRDRPLLAVHDIGDLELAKQFGTVVTEEGTDPLRTVTSFEEKPLHPKSTFVSTGWWFLPKSSLPVLKEYAQLHPDNVGGIFEEFLRRRISVDCFIFREIWKDIGSFESYLSLHREIVDGRVIIDGSSAIGKDVTLRGSIDIGPGVRLGESTLIDCIVFGKTTILDCVLERCIVDEGCVLEGVDLTDKMLRAGTVLRNKTSL